MTRKHSRRPAQVVVRLHFPADDSVHFMPAAKWFLDEYRQTVLWLDRADELPESLEREQMKRQARQRLAHVQEVFQRALDEAGRQLRRTQRIAETRHLSGNITRALFKRAVQAAQAAGSEVSSTTVARHWPDGPPPGPSWIKELLALWRDGKLDPSEQGPLK